MIERLDLLAVLGRGIHLDPQSGRWFPSGDLVMWGRTKGYLGSIASPKEVKENSPYCFLGGGELNILAGVEIYRQYGAKLVVCGYGDRAPYTKEADGPTESQIVSEAFVERGESENLFLPEIKIWTKDMTAPRFNTHQELFNIFSLAVERGFTNVGLVTITSHLPRTIVFAKKHLDTVPEFADLRVKFFSAELVLAEADPAVYALRALKIFSSAAFKRNAGLEARGTEAFLAGRYKA